MARLKKEWEKRMNVSSLQDPLVLVVDMIEGFVKEGALADPAIMEIVPSMQKLLEMLKCRNVFLCDSHPPKTREFLSYPSHCVIGSKETEIIEELQPYIRQIIKKNSTNAFLAPEFSEVLKDLNRYKDIVIVGCCTDLCVLQLALTMQAWLNEHNDQDHRIIIPIDCVETYHIENIHDACFWNEIALQNLEMNGITVVKEIEERE